MPGKSILMSLSVSRLSVSSGPVASVHPLNNDSDVPPRANAAPNPATPPLNCLRDADKASPPSTNRTTPKLAADPASTSSFAHPHYYGLALQPYVSPD